VKGLRQQVRYLQRCAPEASILFIGPSDMLTQTDGEWKTYEMIPYMDRLLRKMALEEHIAYFSLFRWMGGAGSMARWQEIGLAGSDGVHFMRSGARKAGNAVAEWILEGIDN
jgi:lysophospholipase L1-like esterase